MSTQNHEAKNTIEIFPEAMGIIEKEIIKLWN